MNAWKTLAAACLIAAIGASAAHAQEAWKCKMTGEWKQNSPKASGRFNWNVTWTAKEKSWMLSGRANESAGASNLNGACNTTGGCNLSQTYTSGDMSGNTYKWRGTYTESFPSDTTSVLKFRGVWGESHEDTSGTWSAQGNCTRSR